MNKVITIFAISVSLISYSQKELDTVFDYNTLEFSYAKAFLYNLEDQSSGLIIKNGTINPTVIDSNGVKLDSNQTKKVIQVISGSSTGTEDQSSFCFIPHHGIVFYDADNNPLAHISICFYCEVKYVFPKTLKTTNGMNILESIIEELGFPIFSGPEQYEQYGAELRANRVKN